ncbi:MAG: erythromycin esterase family protein, partial [Myxococcota bacterium]
GTAFGRGGVRALTKPGHGGPASVTTGPPHQDGFDAVLSSFAKASQRRAFAIDLRAAPEGAVRRWLDSPIPTWTIGFAYQNDDLARQLIAPRKSFDILVFANEVRATEPL